MGKHTKKKETPQNSIIVKDPGKTEKDIVNMSEAFLANLLSPLSSINSWSVLQKKIFIWTLKE